VLDSGLKSGVLPIFGSTAPVDACLRICLHTRGDFQERRHTAADWLHDDFLRFDILFCVQLTITYSTVGTAKCVFFLPQMCFGLMMTCSKVETHYSTSYTHT
jgi:hypothetical protein